MLNYYSFPIWLLCLLILTTLKSVASTKKISCVQCGESPRLLCHIKGYGFTVPTDNEQDRSRVVPAEKPQDDPSLSYCLGNKYALTCMGTISSYMCFWRPDNKCGVLVSTAKLDNQNEIDRLCASCGYWCGCEERAASSSTIIQYGEILCLLSIWALRFLK